MTNDRMLVANEAWHGNVPDWVVALVQNCNRSSQNQVAKRLGYTPAVVSQVIRNSYAARHDAIEERVRAIYLGGQVECPALGEITSEGCLNWRDRAAQMTSAAPMAVRMFRACRSCPRNAKAEEEVEA